MHIETERKFLVLNDSFKQSAVKALRIKQGYIAHDGGNTVRIRICDNKGILTIKGPSHDGMSRSEWEKEIPLQDAEDLLTLCHAGLIDKTRYIVPAQDHPSVILSPDHPSVILSPDHPSVILSPDHPSVILSPDPKGRTEESLFFEVDEFYADNQGLIMAEIELPNPDYPFPKPEWLGQEVTGDKRYYNSYLTRIPYTKW